MTEIDPATRQAMVASFATEAVPDFTDAQHIMNNVGAIAAGLLVDVHRPAIDTASDRRAGYSPGDTMVAARTQDYLSFVRETGGSRSEGIQTRARLLRNYDKFAPTIKTLKEEIATKSQEDPQSGQGSSSTVRFIEVEGKKYAVRLPREGNEVGPYAIDAHLGAEVARTGMSHVEHIIAASYEDNVTIAEAIPGKTIDTLTPQEVDAIPVEHVSDLVDTVIEGHRRGLVIDPKPNNYIHDPQAGFTLIDHSSIKAKHGDPGDSLGETLYATATALGSIGQFGEDPTPLDTVQDYANLGNIIRADVGLLRKYRELVSVKTTGEDRALALEKIDRKILEEQANADEFLNADWAANDIAARDAIRRSVQRIEENPDLYVPDDNFV